VTFRLQRSADHVGDAVQIDLPIRPDRPVIHRRDLLSLGADGSLAVPALADPARPASYARSLVLATDPAVVTLLAGANVLTRPVVGGAEQRLALAKAELALLPFSPLMDAAGLADRVAGDVAAAVGAVKLATDDDGLVAFFPHGRGSVWLTAEAYRVTVAAERLGIPVEKPLRERMEKLLTAALRSDYPHLIGGQELGALFRRIMRRSWRGGRRRCAADLWRRWRPCWRACRRRIRACWRRCWTRCGAGSTCWRGTASRPMPDWRTSPPRPQSCLRRRGAWPR
jgi:hypothetical protein